MDVKGTVWEVVNWSHVAEYWDQWRAFVYKIKNLPVPYDADNFLTICGNVGFLRRTLIPAVSYLRLIIKI
jgi:hypothetical protein